VSSFVVIAGLSGAGRSSAANTLEDLGWMVMDNLPAVLIPKMVELAGSPGSTTERLALVVGAAPHQDDIATMIEGLRAGIPALRVLFLDSATETLVRRYEATRRRHPFSGTGTLAEAIDAERDALEPVRATADVVVDTTDLNVHQLRGRILDLFDAGDERTMRVTVVSFGFAHGIPRDVDMLIDCRFLPNPHWVDELRPLSGLDASVREYVMAQPVTSEFLCRLEALLELLLPSFVYEGKSYLSLAFGCTGGRHRSVTVAEHFAGVLRALGHEPVVLHRDLRG